MERKVRKSSFEFLRIVCMLMIVAGHVCLQHHTDFDLRGSEWTIQLLLRGFFMIAVNVFVLISGWFGIRLKPSKLLRLTLHTWFYAIFFFVLAVIVGWHVVEWKYDVRIFLPLLTGQYWFVTCYMVLCLLAPLLNRWAENMSGSEMKRLLKVAFPFIYLWPTLCYLLACRQFIPDAGYGIVNFCYLYLLGFYLHRHYVDSHRARFYLYGYMSAGVMLFVVQYGLSWLLGFPFTSFYSYNTLFVFVASVKFFLFFAHVDVKSWLINRLAVPCLSVYLIHFHPCVWEPLCTFLHIEEIHGAGYFLLLFLFPIAIYAVCWVIDEMRALLLSPVERRIIERVVRLFNQKDSY
ncbi:MAG: acyltransferase [Prevotella sp.]|nr:acyltransferase [Prevotella sp.]